MVGKWVEWMVESSDDWLDVLQVALWVVQKVVHWAYLSDGYWVDL